MSDGEHIVYVLKNEGHPPRYYTGLTSNLRDRLDAHNAGRCRHTASGRPWDVIVKFSDEARATAFERYLKSGSGNAFAIRHVRSPDNSPVVDWIFSRRRFGQRETNRQRAAPECCAATRRRVTCWLAAQS